MSGNRVPQNQLRNHPFAANMPFWVCTQFSDTLILPTNAARCPEIDIEDVVLPKKTGEIAENTASENSGLSLGRSPRIFFYQPEVINPGLTFMIHITTSPGWMSCLEGAAACPNLSKDFIVATNGHGWGLKTPSGC